MTPHVVTPLRAALVSLGVLMTMLAVSVAVVSLAQRASGDLPVITEVTDFQFTERSGEPFGRSDMDGQVHIVDFVFTECPDSCPLMGSKMSRLYEAFAPLPGNLPQVRLVSISVDPENDTLEVLRNYASNLGVTDDRWLFLRGELEQVKQLSEKGFLLGAAEFPLGHSTRLVLVDEQGQIRGYYNGLEEASVKQLKNDVRQLVLGR